MPKSLENLNSSPAPRSRKRAISLYLGLAVSVACLYWLFQSVESEQVILRLQKVNPFYLFTAVVTMSVSYVIRSWRWMYMFRDQVLTFASSYRCLILGFFFNNVLPARIGELVRAHLGGKASKLSRAYVLATIASERLADGVTISFIFAMLFVLGAGRVGLSQGKEIVYVALLFGVAALGTAVLLLLRNFVFRLLEKLSKVVPGHLGSYGLLKIKVFIQGLEPLLNPRRLLIISSMSLLVWTIELFVYHQVALAFGETLHLPILALFLAVVNFSSLVPAAPGGLGVIEAIATVALVKVGIERETALAMVFTQHLIQILVVGVPGLYLFFLRLGGKMPSSESEEDSEQALLSEFEESSREDVAQERVEESLHALSNQAHQSLDIRFDLSIVIPCYNEETRLPRTLEKIAEYFTSRPETSYEVIVVDDGSKDNTLEVASSFKERISNLRVLGYPHNRGKGYAVRFGMLNAFGSRVLFDDADGASPIEEVERLEAALSEGASLAIGSRALLSTDTQVKAKLLRKCIGRVFNGIVNVLLVPGIADTQCGFKLFTRSTAQYLFSKQKADGFSFDVEILFLARKAGFKITEVPINWTNIPGSKVNVARDSVKMFFDVIGIRARSLVGGYGHAQTLSVNSESPAV